MSSTGGISVYDGQDGSYTGGKLVQSDISLKDGRRTGVLPPKGGAIVEILNVRGWNPQ